MEYPWYELKENCDEITQGDIIMQCPVPLIKFKGEIRVGDNIGADIEIIDGIILTQACDLANGKVDNVILCSITSKEQFEEQMKALGKSDKEIKKRINSIIKGQENVYHIINFKDIFSIPVSLAKNIAMTSGKRLRLCPPYREHLSQAFARYFMRVGLPVNISFE